MKKSISIHAPREGSDESTIAPAAKQDISIHAPREGSDAGCTGMVITAPSISIHAPREGSDGLGHHLYRPLPDFNPRSP